MSLENDKIQKEQKIQAEEKDIARKDHLLKSYDTMLSRGRERQQDFEQLQAVFDAFAKAFPEDETFKKAAATFKKNTETLGDTLDNGFEVAQQYKYRLDEEKGYLRYQKKKLAEDLK